MGRSGLRNKIKTISNTLHHITIFLLVVVLIWILCSIFGGYSYYRFVSIFLLVFSIIGLLFQTINIATNRDSKKLSLFFRAVSILLLIGGSCLYNASPRFIMSFWENYRIPNASLIYCYDNQHILSGDGDRYAIFQTTAKDINELTSPLRLFDEKRDWAFGGYYLKFSPEKFKNCMISEKLGPEYMFEFDGKKVLVHIWKPCI